LAPRVNVSINSDGRRVSTTSINAPPDYHFAHNPPPLKDFGMAEALLAMKESDDANGDTYMVKLYHDYSATHHDPPEGRLVWQITLAIMAIRIELKRVIVYQLSVVEGPHPDGFASLSVTSLSGEEVAAPSLHLDTTTLQELLEILCWRAGHRQDQIRVVLPNGTLALAASNARMSLAELLFPLNSAASAVPDARSTKNFL